MPATVSKPIAAAARFACMGKPRIVITCPQTGVTVISNFAYEDIAGPNHKTVLFACACGETHRLVYAGPHRDMRNAPPPKQDTPRAS
jgi:hypothetical protein